MNQTTIQRTDYACVSSSVVNEEITVLTIEHPLCNASLSLYGGHVLTWQPTGEKPVFWLSETAEYHEGKAIRGGIPICWPWFGPLLNEVGQNVGNHGFVRNAQWQLDEVEISEQEVAITLSIEGEDKNRLWPEAFNLQQRLVFSNTFTQTLTIVNLAEHQVEFSGALHSYFAVSDPEHTQVSDLADYAFDDKITLEEKQQQPLEHCVGPIDRIYYGNGAQEIVDSQWQRTIRVTSQGCNQWVLWNPGKDIAATMTDVHYGGENEYVCLEAANTEWVTIEPKSSVVLSQQIEVFTQL